MKKKLVTITTSFFKLQIRWNGAVVSTHAALFLGLILLSLFSKAGNMKTMCIAFAIFDVVIIFYLLFHGIKIETSEDDNFTETDTLDVSVNSNRQKNTQSQNNQRQGTINNKVPTPNNTATVQEAQQQSVPTPEPATVQQQEPAEERRHITAVEDMTDDDWADLFKME